MSGVKVISQKNQAQTGGGLALPAGDLDASARVVTIGGKAVSAVIFNDSSVLTGKADASAVSTALAAKQAQSANLDALSAQAATAYGRGLLNTADQAALTALMRGRGTLALRPAANVTPLGYTYFANDDNGGTLYESDGATTWTKIAAGVLDTGGRELAYAENVVGVSITTTVTDVAGCSISFVCGSRPYEIIVGGTINYSLGTATAGNGANAGLYATDTTAGGSTVVINAGSKIALAVSGGVFVPVQGRKHFPATPGVSKSFKLQALGFILPSGSASSLLATTQYPAYIAAREL